MTTIKTDRGTFFDWRDAWREMGRSESEIAAEAAVRAERCGVYLPVRERGGVCGAVRRERWRTWGRCDELTVKMKQRLAIISGYFLRAIKNELRLPSWGRGGREEMTLRRLYDLATMRRDGSPCGLFEAPSVSSRRRDFYRVIEWVRNTLRGWARRGEWDAERCACAERWLSMAPDAPLVSVCGASYSHSYSQAGNSVSSAWQKVFTDTHARESFYESKKHFNDTEERSTPCAQGGQAALTPLVGACAFTVCEMDSEFFAVKGLRRNGSEGAEASGGADGSAARECLAEIPKWRGKKFPRRLWWLVWKHYGDFRALHDGRAVAWNPACFVSWFKSCLAAGRRCGDLYRLYDEKLLKWHGRASDWRIRQDALAPYGMFAELYKAAAELPERERCRV